MDVTKENFVALQSLIHRSIETADFIAFDTEFSGLSVGLDDKQHDYDSVEDRYQKLKHNCQRMNTFQIGICTFKWLEEKQKYYCRPFNFYVFPDSKLFDIDNKVVQFQSSTIKFLREHNFDFNKLFTQGISYQKLSKKDEIMKKCCEKVKEQLQQSQDQQTQQYPQKYYASIGPSSVTQFALIMKEVNDFVEKFKNSENTEIKEIKIESYALRKQLAKEIYTKYKSLNNIYTEHKKGSPNFLIKKWKKRMPIASQGQNQTTEEVVIIDEEKKSNPEDISNSSQETQISTSNSQIKAGDNLYQSFQNLKISEGQQQINTSAQQIEAKQITKVVEEQKKSKEQLEQECYISEMGFSLIVEELIKAKKPLIGHNMIYDIIYLYAQFIDDLPDTYSDFRAKWFDLFPLVYDNKVLAYNAEYFGKCDVASVFGKCMKDQRLIYTCQIGFDTFNGFNKYEGSSIDNQHHEAAFDAYMTGYCFPFIIKYKEKGQKQEERKFGGNNNNNNRNNNNKNQNNKPGQQQYQVKGSSNEQTQQVNQNQSQQAQEKEETKQEQQTIQQQVSNQQQEGGFLQTEEKKRNFGRAGNNKQNYNQSEQNTYQGVQKQSKKVPANLQCDFAKKHLNKIMLNMFDNGRVFNLEPQINQGQDINEKEFLNVVWLEFQTNLDKLSLEEIGQVFQPFGDFTLFKESQTTCLMEIFQLEKDKVPNQSIPSFVEILNTKLVGDEKFLGLKKACLYKETSKFKAHNKLCL